MTHKIDERRRAAIKKILAQWQEAPTTAPLPQEDLEAPARQRDKVRPMRHTAPTPRSPVRREGRGERIPEGVKPLSDGTRFGRNPYEIEDESYWRTD